jgi:aquaporin Z
MTLPEIAATIRSHWPEYLMEAAGLSLFMISACVFTVLLEHPMSPVHQAIESGTLRQVLAGVAMGLTAVAIISSPWGKRSGSHLNPSVTLAFLSLGKVTRVDALFYIVAQFCGGIIGVFVASLLIGEPLRHSAVNYAVTTPGPDGIAFALIAEFAISAILMSVVLVVSNHPKLSRFTPLFAGALVAIFISIEAPISGMSMNPARTLGSAISAEEWTALWIYFTGPPLGMFLAAQLYRLTYGQSKVFCAKFHHHNSARCIFQCNYGALTRLD